MERGKRKACFYIDPLELPSTSTEILLYPLERSSLEGYVDTMGQASFIRRRPRDYVFSLILCAPSKTKINNKSYKKIPSGKIKGKKTKTPLASRHRYPNLLPPHAIHIQRHEDVLLNKVSRIKTNSREIPVSPQNLALTRQTEVIR